MPLGELREEVRQYACACERLLASAMPPEGAPFSQAEVQMIQYYADELNRLLEQVDHTSNL